jgi:hypothetical protein
MPLRDCDVRGSWPCGLDDRSWPITAVCVQGAERVAAFDPKHPEQITENCH